MPLTLLLKTTLTTLTTNDILLFFSFCFQGFSSSLLDFQLKDNTVGDNNNHIGKYIFHSDIKCLRALTVLLSSLITLQILFRQIVKNITLIPHNKHLNNI